MEIFHEFAFKRICYLLPNCVVLVINMTSLDLQLKLIYKDFKGLLDVKIEFPITDFFWVKD